MMPDLEFHEMLDGLALMEGEALDELAADIQAHGLLQPIELYEGKVLDGRNRCNACKIAGVIPATVNVNPEDPIAYVLSRNRHRLHHTVSQLAWMADWGRQQYDLQAKGRQAEQARRNQPQSQKVETFPPLEKTKARDEAGKAVGVSGRTVDKATKVRKEGIPALGKLVQDGKLDVTKAAKLADLPKETQETLLEDAERNEWSGRQIMEEVKRVQSEESPKRLPAVKPMNGVQYAKMAIVQLEKISPKDTQRDKAFDMVVKWIGDHR